MTIPKSPLVLAGLALAAYFLFFKKSGPAAPAPAPAIEQGGQSSAQSAIDAAAAAASELLKFGAGQAKENLGSYGATPGSLNGMVASVGGFGDLGGSFYGGY